MNNTFQFAPGKAILESIIHNNGNSSTDITDLVREINIHSSVNIKSTIIELSVLDNISYLSKAPLSAGDVITVNITYSDVTLERKVKIMEVNTIIPLNERNLSYIIKCASDLRYASTHVKISKAFQGTPSDIAFIIQQQYSIGTIGVWEQSRNNITFVAPNWDPIKSIQYLAKQSESTNFPTRMKFFQDSKMNYHFTSLPNIISTYSSNQDIITYTYGINTRAIQTSNGNIPNTEGIATAILKINYLDSFNIEKSIQSGSVQNTNYTYDLTTGILNVQSNNLWNTYSLNNFNNTNLYPYEDMGQGRISIDYVNSYSSGVISQSSNITNPRYDYDRSQEIEIEVLGNQISDIGQSVNLEIIQRENGNGGDGNLDPRWSGTYVITAKRDVHTKDTHKMVLRCTKNSLDSGNFV